MAPKDVGGLRILIVEDHADGAESLAVLLRIEGHDVLIVRDGPSGWSKGRNTSRTSFCWTWVCRG